MALTDPQDCLAYHQSRALTSYRDVSGASCQKVVAAKKAFQAADKHKQTKPERLAVAFYAANHGMALLSASKHPYERLTKAELQFVENYHKIGGEAAARAFYYLLEICTREARHNKSLKASYSSAEKVAQLKAKMEELFGLAIANVHASVGGSNEETIIKEFFDKTPDAPIGAYCASLQHVYYKHKWASSYGGPAWGNIADCMARFVTGENTAEMMLDTVWTLEHNTAAIFNKPSELFTHNSGHLLRILDVQRSGQMVEAVLTDQQVGAYASPVVKTMCQWLKQEFPTKIGDYVDWFKVEALGANGSYHMEKKQQEQQQMTPEQKAKLAAQKKAAEEAKVAALKAEQEAAVLKKAMEFVVMPGLTLQKVVKKRAA